MPNIGCDICGGFSNDCVLNNIDHIYSLSNKAFLSSMHWVYFDMVRRKKSALR